MNHEDLKEILHLLSDKDIAELAIERGNEAVRIKRFVTGSANGQSHPVITVSSAVLPVPTTAPVLSIDESGIAEDATEAAQVEEDFHLVKSHTVGFFRETKTSNTEPIIQPGHVVEVGQVVGFIDVLRLFNDVRSDVAGEVVKRLVSDGQPVEYGQALFAIRIRPDQLPA
jgi:acetyl-CoA carboxylase biotin carboxyl carrier protein